MWLFERAYSATSGIRLLRKVIKGNKSKTERQRKLAYKF